MTRSRKMFLATVLVCLGFCQAQGSSMASESVPTGRIVGGTNASIEDFPYMVSVQSSIFICGGAVISSIWVLTSAYCIRWSSLGTAFIYAGSANFLSGGTKHKVVQLVMHSGYNRYNYDYNIGLIRVSTQFPFGDTVQSIKLPESGESIVHYAEAIFTGWGSLTPEGSASKFLQKVTLPVATNAECQKYYEKNITDRMMCTSMNMGNRAACNCDEGGPLVVDGKLVGLLSWGLGCGDALTPEVFTRVAALRTWIKGNTGV